MWYGLGHDFINLGKIVAVRRTEEPLDDMRYCMHVFLHTVDINRFTLRFSTEEMRDAAVDKLLAAAETYVELQRL